MGRAVKAGARASLGALVLAGLLAGPGMVAARDGEDGAGTAREVSDLVNALLGVFMGGGEVSGPALQREVEEVGGVPFRRDVPVAFMSHDELASYLAELLEEDYPPEQARVDERLLAAFDLLAPGTDLRALRARLLEENVAGFYDERPHRRRLYAVSEDRTLTPMNQIVLAHELRHALQDQYGDLHAALPDDVGDFDDRRLAWMALLEGDATLVMERFLLRRLGGLGAGLGDGEALGSGLGVPGLFELPGAPPVLRDQLVMPYLVGRELARAIDARGGADAMVAAWGHPPESTEQVLHPEKFFAREKPRSVLARPDPPAGTLLAEGVLGELLLRTLLEEDGAAPGAAGWGGDAWRLWDVEGATLLVWTSVWDTATDAAEFADALEGRFTRLWGAPEPEGEWTVFERSDGWRIAVRRDGDSVSLRSAEAGAAGLLPGEAGLQPGWSGATVPPRALAAH